MEERVFRILVLMLLAAFALVWGTNLLRVGVSRGVVYSRQEGLGSAFFTRTLAIASFTGLVLYVGDPRSMAWSQLSAPTWMRLLGAPISATGVSLLWWVLSTLGRNFSMSLTTEGHTLVTQGPYRWVRHPMYTAFVLIFGGLFLLTANCFIGASAGFLYGAAMLIRTPREERLLIEAFGDEYRRYMERTGRFLPKLGSSAR